MFVFLTDSHLSPLPTEAEGCPQAAEAAASFVMERGFDLIERLVQPPVDQFLKCVFVVRACVCVLLAALLICTN